MNIAESFSTALQAGNMAQQQADMQAANKIKLLQGMMTSLAQGMEGAGAMAQGVAGAAVRTKADMREEQLFNESAEVRAKENELKSSDLQLSINVMNRLKEEKLDGLTLEDIKTLSELQKALSEKETARANANNVVNNAANDAEIKRLQKVVATKNMEQIVKDFDYVNKSKDWTLPDGTQFTGTLKELIHHSEGVKELSSIKAADLAIQRASEDINYITSQINLNSQQVYESQDRMGIMRNQVREQILESKSRRVKVDLANSLISGLLTDSDTGEMKEGDALFQGLESVRGMLVRLQGVAPSVGEELAEGASVLRKADEKYKQQVKQFGPNSSEAKSALVEVKDATGTLLKVTSGLSQDAAVTDSVVSRYQNYLEGEAFKNTPLDEIIPFSEFRSIIPGTQRPYSQREFFNSNTDLHNDNEANLVSLSGYLNSSKSNLKPLLNSIHVGDGNAKDALADLSTEDGRVSFELFVGSMGELLDDRILRRLSKEEEFQGLGPEISTERIVGKVLHNIAEDLPSELSLPDTFKMDSLKSMATQVTNYSDKDLNKILDHEIETMEKDFKWLLKSDPSGLTTDNTDDKLILGTYLNLKKMKLSEAGRIDSKYNNILFNADDSLASKFRSMLGVNEKGKFIGKAKKYFPPAPKVSQSQIKKTQRQKNIEGLRNNNKASVETPSDFKINMSDEKVINNLNRINEKGYSKTPSDVFFLEQLKNDFRFKDLFETGNLSTQEKKVGE